MPDTIPFPQTKPTQQQRLQRQANQIQANSNNLWQQLENAYNTIGTFCWQPPDGFTVQQMFDLFGTNAGTLLKLTAAYSAMIQTYTGAAPASPVPAGWKYVVNQDGTVTVTGP